MNDWPLVPLGDVITLQRGFDLPSQKRQPGKVPIVSSSGISDYHSQVGVKGPGVVTGRYGTIGQVFHINEDFWPLNTTLWGKDFHGNDHHFASYLLRTVDFQSCSDKSSVPGVNRNDLHRIPVLLPPLAEQKAIAAVLGALDDKIALNRRMNATLEGIARALFQSWFVDFDPVRQNMDRREQKSEMGRVKSKIKQPSDISNFTFPSSLFNSPATAALFPEHLEDSPLGHIPKGWMAQRLPDAIEVNPRRTLKSGTIAPYLDMKNLPTQGHSAEEVIDREYSSGTKFQNGDTLLARSDALRTHAIQNMTGTSGHQRVPSECFQNFWLAVPPPNIARSFDELTAPLMAKIKANSTESRTLATLRDTLLPKLLSGEISVAAANHQIT